MKKGFYRRFWMLQALLLAILAASTAFAISFPPPPDVNQNIFYVDRANVIDAKAGKQINAIATKLWQDQEIPIIVAVLNSLQDQSANDYTIDSYAAALFNYWGIGSQKHNYGILILVLKNDRKARIELGNAWGHEYDVDSKMILDRLMIPYFKKGDFAQGVLTGVEGIDHMVRGLDIPRPVRAWWVLPLFIVVLVLLIGVIASLFQSGRKGWGWGLLVLIGVVIWFVLRSAARGGGALGGGSSGGGGATGSW